MEEIPNSNNKAGSPQNEWLRDDFPAFAGEKQESNNENRNGELAPDDRRSSAERGEKVQRALEKDEMTSQDELPLYKWDEFMQLRDDDKLNYLNTLRDRFGANLKTLSFWAMDVNEKKLAKEANRVGYEPKRGGGKRGRFDKRREGFGKWLRESKELRLFSEVARENNSRTFTIKMKCSVDNARQIMQQVQSIDDGSMNVSMVSSTDSESMSGRTGESETEDSLSREIENVDIDSEENDVGEANEGFPVDDLPKYSMEHFKTLSTEEKKDYLNNFYERYSAGVDRVAKYVLECPYQELVNEARKIGYNPFIYLDRYWGSKEDTEEDKQKDKEFSAWLGRRNEERLHTITESGKTLQQELDDLPKYEWKEFMELGDDEKLKYLNTLQDRFNSNLMYMAKVVLGVELKTLKPEADRLGFVANKKKPLKYEGEVKWKDFNNWLDKNKREQKARLEKNRASTVTLSCSASKAEKIVRLIHSINRDSDDIAYYIEENPGPDKPKEMDFYYFRIC